MGKQQTAGKITIRQKVVNFAKKNLGIQVGTGECFDLADKALKNAGAKSAGDLMKVLTKNGNYIWGKKINLLKSQPGDILQFRNHKIKTEVTTETITTSRFSGTATKKSTSKDETARPHHTAIVSENNGKGVMKIFEQNVIPPSKKTVSKKVQKNKLYIKNTVIIKTRKEDSLMSGDKKKIRTKTTIRVSGTIWAYRPIPK